VTTYFFVDKLPKKQSGVYAHYDHQIMQEKFWEQLDVRKYIQSQEHSWVMQTQKWHTKLSRTALQLTEWWWLHQASKLVTWNLPVFKPFFFSIAIIELTKNRSIEQLYLLNCPQIIADYIQDLSPNNQCVQSKITKKSFKEKSGIQKILFFKRTLSLLFNSLSIFIQNKHSSFDTTKKVLIYSHFLGIESFQQHSDHYFGKMFDFKETRNFNDISWIYYTETRSKDQLNSFNKLLHQSHTVFTYLERHLFAVDYLKIVKILFNFVEFYKDLKSRLPNIYIDGYYSRLFASDFYTHLIINRSPVRELVVYHAIKNHLKESQVETIIYPYEDKSIEHAILKAVGSSINKPKTIGLAHACHSTAYLSYLREANSPQPDLIATTGEKAQEWLNQLAYIPQNKMVTWGSKRYHSTIQKVDRPLSNQLRILLLVGIYYEISMFTNFLKQAPNVLGGCQLWIRKKPHAWQKEQNECMVPIQKDHTVNYRDDDASLQKQFEWCDIALFCYTSAGIEAMLCGVPTIWVDLHDTIMIDPLTGKGDLSCIPRCFSGSDLKNTLQKFRKMENKSRKQLIEGQIHFASQIYSPIQYQELEKTL